MRVREVSSFSFLAIAGIKVKGVQSFEKSKSWYFYNKKGSIGVKILHRFIKNNRLRIQKGCHVDCLGPIQSISS